MADWESAPLADATVFVTTGPFGWTNRMVGHGRPFFERFVEMVAEHDPYATVGLAHLLMVGSGNPPPLTIEQAPSVAALLAHDFTYGLLVETQLQPKEPWRSDRER